MEKIQIWYVEIWCGCPDHGFRVECYAPFSSQEKAEIAKNEMMESPFHPHDSNNYTVGFEDAVVLLDGRIVCTQHVFRSESMDTGVNSIECKWYV